VVLEAAVRQLRRRCRALAVHHADRITPSEGRSWRGKLRRQVQAVREGELDRHLEGDQAYNVYIN